jgi:F-type H+-transporting ATPase subunit gamma
VITPSIGDLIGSVKVMLQAYDNGEIDRLYLVYNKFVNTMVQHTYSRSDAAFAEG